MRYCRISDPGRGQISTYKFAIYEDPCAQGILKMVNGNRFSRRIIVIHRHCGLWLIYPPLQVDSCYLWVTARKITAAVVRQWCRNLHRDCLLACKSMRHLQELLFHRCLRHLRPRHSHPHPHLHLHR